MKPVNFFPFLALTLFGLSNGATIRPLVAVSPRAECELSEFVECIVSLAELPLQITTCAEALNDINDTSPDKDPIKQAAQAADCIAEATLAGVELPSHCAGCTKVLDGECPSDKIPCTGPPPPSEVLPGTR
ncbi:hypothetical protein M422DRAFT_45184 [Sphaerobolus stellatus SS14]|nr:hypothetical protein M422DRAFT_45184 [Sphaerobolus stellatus SS14]